MKPQILLLSETCWLHPEGDVFYFVGSWGTMRMGMGRWSFRVDCQKVFFLPGGGFLFL